MTDQRDYFLVTMAVCAYMLIGALAFVFIYS